MPLLVTRGLLVLDCSCCSVPATLGHLRMLVRGAPVPKEEHQRNTERDKNYKTRTCMLYAEAFFYCPLKAFMKIHEIIHYEMEIYVVNVRTIDNLV